MRIGILTFHRSENYGAFLQCYALVQHLKKRYPGAQVEVIDYTRKDTVIRYRKYKAKRILLRPADFWEMYLRERMFRAHQAYLPLSKGRLVSDDVARFVAMYRGKYDIIVVGSDVVFGIQRSVPFPNPYWLHEDLGCRRLSFAAASHGTDPLKLSDQTRAYCKESLDNFEYIGVRDESTKEFLTSIKPDLKVDINCDPTVLMDVSQMPSDGDPLEYLKACKGFDPAKRSIGLMIGDPFIGKLIRERFGEEYNIVAVYNKEDSAHVNLYNLPIFVWARIFSLFALTVTTFFHGGIFSLKCGTPIIAVNKNVLDEKVPGKVENLMKQIGMEDCFYHLSRIRQDPSQMLNRCDDLLHENDRDAIAAKIASLEPLSASFDRALDALMEKDT